VAARAVSLFLSCLQQFCITYAAVPLCHRLAFLLGVEPVSSLAGSELHVSSAALVFLNGNILGLHRRPHRFVKAMRWAAATLRLMMSIMNNSLPGKVSSINNFPLGGKWRKVVQAQHR